MSALAPSISSAAEALADISVGQRAWFWLCPDLGDDEPLLLVQSLRRDPRQELLLAQAGRLAPPPGAPIFQGLASVDATGKLAFGSPALSRRELRRLARWAARHVAAHPDLARLKDASFLDVGPDGLLRARHDDPDLWAAVPAPVPPGSIAETAQRLRGLAPGKDCWFWMTASGPGGQPWLTLGVVRRDPSGESFARRIQALRRQSLAPEPGVQGVARLTAGGVLALTTESSLAEAEEIVAALLDAHGAALAPALFRAGAVRLVQVRDGALARVLKVDPPAPEGPAPAADLSRQAAATAALLRGEAASFWFTDEDADGAPLLLLDTDAALLKEAAKAAKGEGRAARGQARLAKKGWIEFRTRDAFPGFVAALAGWVAAHRAEWPALGGLKGARMVQRDDADEVVDRQQDDDAWREIP